MNEIQLSNNLQQIELEINHHKNIAGQSIWEIGRRLNHVKENDLAHGEFGSWVESINMSRTEAFRFMKVATELPNVSTLEHLGTSALYLIATLSEEERSKEHTTSKGEVKKPDEMTVRELQELKRQLKAKDEQIEMQVRMIEDLNEQESQVIEKEVVIEKIPSDYKELKQLSTEISSENQSLKQEKERLEREMTQKDEALQMKRTIENDELEQAQLVRLQRNADINVHKLIINMNDFVKEQSVTVYDSASIAGATAETKEKLSNSIKRVEKLLSEIKQEIGGEVAWIIN